MDRLLEMPWKSWIPISLRKNLSQEGRLKLPKTVFVLWTKMPRQAWAKISAAETCWQSFLLAPGMAPLPDGINIAFWSLFGQKQTLSISVMLHQIGSLCPVCQMALSRTLAATLFWKAIVKFLCAKIQKAFVQKALIGPQQQTNISGVRLCS